MTIMHYFNAMTLPETCVGQGRPKAMSLVFDALIEDTSISHTLFGALEFLFFLLWGSAP